MFYKIIFVVNFILNIFCLGIGDWAQSPIPNPQSPIIYSFIYSKILFNYFFINN